MIVHADCLEHLRTVESNSFDSLVTDPPAGIAFMGKDWDKDKGGRDSWVKWMTGVMSEALRVMKPGAHGLVWALPRTSHWTATALEDAGFEVRDVITHLFGTGFPKSLDVDKAIKRAAGVEHGVIGSGWKGWGTALKPASEHWILVRKPMSEKTVAANVLKWGVGGINVDGCRIGNGGDYSNHNAGSSGSKTLNWNSSDQSPSSTEYRSTQGRFPANLTLDEDAAAMLDEQSGISKSTGGRTVKRSGKYQEGKVSAPGIWSNDDPGFGDTGGASRFFYVAKASKADRNAGLEGRPVVDAPLGDDRPCGQSMTRLDGRPPRQQQNTHPTVKSTKLMSYLIRLVTPLGGIVLDPFMGSGSTGVAAKAEGMEFVGIEREAEYHAIAAQRIG